MEINKHHYFVFESYYEALDLHRKLLQIMRTKGVIVCADLCIAANIEYDKKDIEYFNYGWTDIKDIKLEPYDDLKWVLRMPVIKHFKYI